MIWRLLNCGLVAISKFSGFPLTIPWMFYMSSLCLNRVVTSKIWKDQNLPHSLTALVHNWELPWSGTWAEGHHPFYWLWLSCAGDKVTGFVEIQSLICDPQTKMARGSVSPCGKGNKSVIMSFRTKNIEILKWLNFKRKQRKSSCFIHFIPKYNGMYYYK